MGIANNVYRREAMEFKKQAEAAEAEVERLKNRHEEHLAAHRTADAHDCAEMEEMYQREKAEVERLNAHLDVADRTMKCDGDRIVALQIENERLRTALEEISAAAGANHCGVLARAALRGEGEK